MDVTAAGAADAVQGAGVAVAEHRAGSERERRRHPPPAQGEFSMAHGVDATVDPVSSHPALQPVVDPWAQKPSAMQLS